MNIAQAYNKATNPPTEEQIKEKEALKALQIVAELNELNKLQEWLDNSKTKVWLESLETLSKQLDDNVRELSSSQESFSSIGKLKAHESKILRKVIDYARTGKYSSE
jgi:hypothetical protein